MHALMWKTLALMAFTGQLRWCEKRLRWWRLLANCADAKNACADGVCWRNNSKAWAINIIGTWADYISQSIRYWKKSIGILILLANSIALDFDVFGSKINWNVYCIYPNSIDFNWTFLLILNGHFYWFYGNFLLNLMGGFYWVLLGSSAWAGSGLESLFWRTLQD